MELVEQSVEEEIEEEADEPAFLVGVFKHISSRLKAIEDNPNNLTIEQINKIIDKIRREPQEPIINVDVDRTVVNVPAPSINVTSPAINLPAPIVNIDAPVTVEQPRINVEAPIVTMPAVNVEAPIINTPRIKSITFTVLNRDFDDNIIDFQAIPIYEED